METGQLIAELEIIKTVVLRIYKKTFLKSGLEKMLEEPMCREAEWS